MKILATLIASAVILASPVYAATTQYHQAGTKTHRPFNSCERLIAGEEASSRLTARRTRLSNHGILIGVSEFQRRAVNPSAALRASVRGAPIVNT
jgi:hypothetical protein